MIHRNIPQLPYLEKMHQLASAGQKEAVTVSEIYESRLMFSFRVYFRKQTEAFYFTLKPESPQQAIEVGGQSFFVQSFEKGQRANICQAHGGISSISVDFRNGEISSYGKQCERWAGFVAANRAEILGMDEKLNVIFRNLQP